MIKFFFKILILKFRKLSIFLYLIKSIRHNLTLINQKILPHNFIKIKIKTKDELSKKFVLFGKSSYKVNAPNFHKKEISSITGEYKSLNAIFLHNTYVSPYSSSILKGENFFISSLVYCNPNIFGVSTYGFLLIRECFIDNIKKKSFIVPNSRIKKNIIKIDKGILIGSCGSENWYHWIIECLPKLYLADMLPDNFINYPIILPDHCSKNNNFSECLELFDLSNKKLLFLSKINLAKVNNLIYLDDVIKAPFQVKKNKKVSMDNYSFNQKFILNYSKCFRNYAEINNNEKFKNKRIFLARKNSIRNYNQDQIIKIALQYGFETKYLEDYKLKEQVKLIANTNFLIGPSGAAWVSLIFNNRISMKCLTWLPNYYSEACTYSLLAGIFGHQLNYLYVDYENSEYHDFNNDNYFLDPNYFEKNLIKLLNE